jgi:hypothetical protein
MSFKENMMGNMMGKMSAEEKKEMMEKMMEHFFSNTTEDDKQKMMSEMMPKMMEHMMGNAGRGPDCMMGSMAGGKDSMMDMMHTMMGGRGAHGKDGDKEGEFNPMHMCGKMMSSISRNSEIATFATPEVRQLFEDWVQQVDDEILNLINDNASISPEEIAGKLKISKNSAIYFLSRLAQKGKIDLDIGKAKKRTTSTG